MEDIINSLGEKIYSVNGHDGYIIKWKLISPFIQKWSGNRDPDIKRIKDMLKYYNAGGYIPLYINLAELKKKDRNILVCYDGNHRRKVFDKSAIEIKCIIDVLFNSNNNEILQAFNNINKSIQVPAIYLDNTQDIDDNDTSSDDELQDEIDDEHENFDNDIKNDIEILANTFVKKYKNFASSSNQCHSPNFNRDIFIDNIYQIYKQFDGKISIKQIKELLYKLNEYYSKNMLCRDHSKYNKLVIEKCKKYNMFLFLERIIPFEHIKRVYLD